MLIMLRELDNRYTVLKTLGSGGVGEVFLARDEVLGREVAVKILGKRFADDAEFVERFKREARSTALLSHPNIVSIHDLGETTAKTDEDSENDTSNLPILYITMEYVRGMTFSDLIRERGPLPPSTAVEIALSTARGLSAAHEHSIVHRDVKPGNILIASPATDAPDTALREPLLVKVTDFGISRRATERTLTEKNAIMGTAYYLSPEQAQGRLATHSSDLYSLGIVLYEMLTGRRPFEATEMESPLVVAMKHIMETPRPSSETRQEIPPALDEITLKLLSKDAEERPADATELVRELERIVELLATDSSAVHYPSEPETEQIEAPDYWTGEAPQDKNSPRNAVRTRQERRYLLPITAILLLALMLVAVGAFSGGWREILGVSNSQNSTLVSVPTLVGESLEQARSTAGDGFRISVEDRKSSGEPAGVILESDPGAGDEIQRGGIVGVVVSNGPSGGPTMREETRDKPSNVEAEIKDAVREYYAAVDRENWTYTYDHLDQSSQSLFTREEWQSKNQWFADLENLSLSSTAVDVSNLSSSESFAEVNVRRTFENGLQINRDTVFLNENGVWKHRLVGNELAFFMPDATYEEFVDAQEAD